MAETFTGLCPLCDTSVYQLQNQCPRPDCPFRYKEGVRAAVLRWRRSVALAVASGLLLGGFLAGASYTLLTRINPPITFLHSEFLRDTIRIGDDLTFIVRAATSIDLACVGSITREFYTSYSLDGKTVRRKKRTAGSSPIIIAGETSYLIDLELPLNMVPGEWEFLGETTYDCGFWWALVRDFPRSMFNGGVMRLRTPVMRFTLLPKL